MLLLFLLWAAAPGWWLLLCRNEMERGGVVKGSRGYKKAMNLPEEDRVGGGGVTCGPLIPVAGALERSRRGKMSAGVGLGMGNEKEEGRGFRMDLCKRRRLQCERSVVHSGKSLSHAVSLDARSQKNAKERESFVCCCFVFFSDWELLVGCVWGRLQETPEAATARGQAVRWSAWGGGDGLAYPKSPPHT